MSTTIAFPSKWQGLSAAFRSKFKVRNSGPITAFEIENETLRVAVSTPRGGDSEIARIEVGSLRFAADADRSNPEVLGAAIAATLQELKIKPGQVVMGVPRQSVLLRTITLPEISDIRELASMVHMQVGKDLPFRSEDAVIDFTTRPGPTVSKLPTSSSSESVGSAGESAASPASGRPVLVAAVKRETVDFYKRVAAAGHFDLVALGWLSQANARCLSGVGNTGSNKATALVLVRQDEVAIDIVADGFLIFSRGVSLAGFTGAAGTKEGTVPAVVGEAGASNRMEADPVKWATGVVIEVVRTLHSYGSSDLATPLSQLWLAGAMGSETPVLQLLSERLKMPCQRLELGNSLALPASGREMASTALGAIGLALGAQDPDGLPFNFLEPKRPAVQRNMGRIRTLVGIAAMVVLGISFLGLRSHLIQKRMVVNKAVRAELAEAQKKSPIYRQMQQQAASVQAWVKEGRNWLEQYAYLSSVLPASEDLYITSFSVSGQGNIHLAVQARSGEILANLDRQLRAAGYEVKPLAVNPGTDKHGYNFRSSVELIAPPKMKIDLSKLSIPARPADDASLEGKSKASRKGGRS